MKLLLFLLIPFILLAGNNSALQFASASSEYGLEVVSQYRPSDNTGFISMWINAVSLASTNILFSSSDEATNVNRMTIYTRTDGTVVVEAIVSGITFRVTTVGTISAGQNYNIIVGTDNLDWYIWFDGVAQSLSVIAGGNDGKWFADVLGRDNVSIGCAKHTSIWAYSNIVMDELVISSTTPTQDIVDNIYNSGTPKDETSNPLYTIVGYFRFEEGSGTTVTDAVGTVVFDLVNTPTWVTSSFGWDAGNTEDTTIGFGGFNGWDGFGK